MKQLVQSVDRDVADYEQVMARRFAERYAEHRDPWTGEPAMSVITQMLCDTLADRQAHVLDVGTGRGRDAVALARAGHTVTGIDVATVPDWAVLAGQWAGRLRFEAVGLLDLPATAAYDAVLDNGCMHHQHPDSYGAYLRRLADVLRGDGLLMVSVFASGDGRGSLYTSNDERLHRDFGEQELVDLVTSVGFTFEGSCEVPRGLLGLNYMVATFRRAAA